MKLTATTMLIIGAALLFLAMRKPANYDNANRTIGGLTVYTDPNHPDYGMAV